MVGHDSSLADQPGSVVVAVSPSPPSASCTHPPGTSLVFPSPPEGLGSVMDIH